MSKGWNISFCVKPVGPGTGAGIGTEIRSWRANESCPGIRQECMECECAKGIWERRLLVGVMAAAGKGVKTPWKGVRAPHWAPQPLDKGSFSLCHYLNDSSKWNGSNRFFWWSSSSSPPDFQFHLNPLSLSSHFFLLFLQPIISIFLSSFLLSPLSFLSISLFHLLLITSLSQAHPTLPHLPPPALLSPPSLLLNSLYPPLPSALSIHFFPNILFPPHSPVFLPPSPPPVPFLSLSVPPSQWLLLTMPHAHSLSLCLEMCVWISFSLWQILLWLHVVLFSLAGGILWHF